MIISKEEYLEDVFGALDRYANHGIPTGSFLRAVLANDLFGAMGRADINSSTYLHDTVKLIYNQFPSNIWGSYEIVDNYIKNFKNKNL